MDELKEVVSFYGCGNFIEPTILSL